MAFKFNTVAFLVALIVGLLVARYIEPEKEVIIQNPTPINFGDVFEDTIGNRWTYQMNVVGCTDGAEPIPINSQ